MAPRSAAVWPRAELMWRSRTYATSHRRRRSWAQLRRPGAGAWLASWMRPTRRQFSRLLTGSSHTSVGSDILVNNAGIFPSGPLEDVTVEEVDRTLAVHVRAVFVASQAAARHMTDGGRIISIGSCFAERVPYAGVSLYAMSKAALLGLTKGLARDLGPRGVTVTLVHPGSTDTDMNPANGPTAEYERTFIALRRYARPEDIAETVAFLASTRAGYITGTSVAVDGGFAA